MIRTLEGHRADASASKASRVFLIFNSIHSVSEIRNSIESGRTVGRRRLRHDGKAKGQIEAVSTLK